ncbi:bifunctional oligoribonuclease/PAP phosphatase NrnA [candidate division KSB1 bacterium]
MMSSMKGEERWNRLLSRMQELDDFVLTTHVNPDGDALGAEIALRLFLESLGKKVRIINPSPLPQIYAFLDTDDLFEQFDPDLHTPDFFEEKTVFSLDNSSLNRMDQLGPVLSESECNYICLDHHPFEGGLPGFHYVDENASATGELVYRLITDLDGKIDRRMAEALYVAILTDTGGFRFPNTTAAAFEITAEMIRTGVSPAKVYDRVYELNRPNKIQLLGLALKDLEMYEDGRVALLVVSNEMMVQTGAERFEVDGFVETLRTIAGVELGALLLELSDGHVKASLRSKWFLNVQKLAAEFGGGGHPRAAGFVKKGTIGSVKKSLLDKAIELMSSQKSTAE